MKRKVLAVLGGAALAVGTISMVAAPAAAKVCTDEMSACTLFYDGYGGVTIQDTACDSTGVYGEYRRTQQSGTTQTVNNYQGCNTSVNSGSDKVNYVYKHRAAANYTGPDSYSGWEWKP
ncbi:hypothetical protein AB0D32_06785 [Micromonospora sp. NPDC048170]|uniref:hypothetical protein n=1 Tax=Micromonospora sp. NPDC048170 TaxID=3154819 RepID=UPI00340229B8